MNCDDCEERVLDLIEQEGRDPETVRSLLERCPDCRARFDEMKAVLEQVAAFEVEEPSPATDQAILAAARGRVLARRRRWTWRGPHWAAAAVALLAVGVGVWTIPRGAEDGATKSDEVSAVADIQHDEAAVQDLAYEDSVAPPSGATAPAEASLDADIETKSEAESRGGGATAALRRRSTVARQPPTQNELVLAEADNGPASTASLDFAATADATEEAAPKKSRTPEAAPRPKSRRCERRLRGIESQDRAVTAEEALWLGSCYREAGDWRRARRWFEQAASEPATRDRATRELDRLPSD